MTCAKKLVVCKLTKDGKTFVGNNDCFSPQECCPRDLGEDYSKCKEICNQGGHAEMVALQLMIEDGVDPAGSCAQVFGIDHVCKDCFRTLRDVGVNRITIFLQEKV